MRVFDIVLNFKDRENRAHEYVWQQSGVRESWDITKGFSQIKVHQNS
jgi:hypothetical protein